MRSLAQDAFCFVTVIILLGNACGYTFLENLQSMIDNERRGDFSTFDELPPFKLKYFMRTNSNHEYDQADNSIVNEKRQMILKVVEALYRTDKEKTAVLRWMLIRHILAHFSSKMRFILGLATDAEMEHEEIKPTAMTLDKKIVSLLIGYMQSNMRDPFNVVDHP
ncbi:Hypothetical predicted protein [Mytilus galloprovincialis]|uniref:Uncharacterized protein n=1 Tax=Mytilus galloprovincialis TaxID=29158 RepID=A0A8B6FKI2_MYTGA|nr:Hypothetical predicted protein [Mytilus galloprovincialis]